MAKEKILITGNEAVGEAAILAGCRFYAGYPITPQNELTAYMAKRMREVDGTFIQSESELAGINMVLGAATAGARAMTSSSSPGISLKQEGISYLAACELPAVIVNIMRGGPGLGNIAPAQSDYFQATKGGGHGDYHQIVLAPASVQELASLTTLAFDLADKYRNPVMILADGILGQMMEPVSVARRPYSVCRKIRNAKPWALTGCKGRRPNVIRSLFLKEGELEKLNQKLQEKYEKIKASEVRWESLHLKSEIILVAYGTPSRICKAAMQKARGLGLKVGLIRPISLWPFPAAIISRVASWAKAFLVVEMSSGQMVEDVRLAANGQAEVKFYGRCGGGVPTEEAILKEIQKIKDYEEDI
jgi:2-oxoglutarate ferredoxin oxidoreductase subunit alpha